MALKTLFVGTQINNRKIHGGLWGLNNQCIMSLIPGFAVPQLNYIGLCNQMNGDMRFPTF